MATYNQNMIAMDELKTYFDALQIDMPPIPPHLVEKMQNFHADFFGTRPDAPPLNEVLAFVQEAVTAPQEDYLLMGIGGHGVKSLAMHYYCATDKVALFYQLYFGIPEFEDARAQQNRLNAAFYAIELILEAVDEKHGEGLIPKGQRLLILESDFYGQGWGWIKGYPGFIESTAWHNETPVTLSALNELYHLGRDVN